MKGCKIPKNRKFRGKTWPKNGESNPKGIALASALGYSPADE